MGWRMDMQGPETCAAFPSCMHRVGGVRSPHAQIRFPRVTARVPSGAVTAGGPRFFLNHSFHSNPIARRWEASFLSRETLRPRGLNGMLEPKIAALLFLVINFCCQLRLNSWCNVCLSLAVPHSQGRTAKNRLSLCLL